MRNHTATHLVNRVLHSLLPVTCQRSSHVSPHQLRLDFSAFQVLSHLSAVQSCQLASAAVGLLRLPGIESSVSGPILSFASATVGLLRLPGIDLYGGCSTLRPSLLSAVQPCQPASAVVGLLPLPGIFIFTGGAPLSAPSHLSVVQPCQPASAVVGLLCLPGRYSFSQGVLHSPLLVTCQRSSFVSPHQLWWDFSAFQVFIFTGGAPLSAPSHLSAVQPCQPASAVVGLLCLQVGIHFHRGCSTLRS